MPDKLKLPLSLIIASLLLSGCMPLPGEIPDLAGHLTAVCVAIS